VDGTGSGSCPTASFGDSGIGSSGSVTRELVALSYCLGTSKRHSKIIIKINVIP
jgi:hypothetical protein